MSKVSKELTDEQKRAMDIVYKFGAIVRYQGGFWAEKNAILKAGYNGGRIAYYYPENYVGIGTIKALIKRGLLKVTQEHHYGKYPIECKLNKD